MKRTFVFYSSIPSFDKDSVEQQITRVDINNLNNIRAMKKRWEKNAFRFVLFLRESVSLFQKKTQIFFQILKTPPTNIRNFFG